MGDGKKTGLVLTGGGARAAYQVGVLRGIAHILTEAGWLRGRNPYHIICGTSAGAINAAALACHADAFDTGLDLVESVWEGITVGQVYRADSLGMLRTGARWLSLLSFGWLLRRWISSPPNSLLDNTPLVTLLHRLLDLRRLDAVLAEGALHALAVTASSYTRGRHVTFFQTEAEIQPWVRSQRLAWRGQIGVEHLLASAGLPFIFPATPIYYHGRCEYFGDGAMRQLAPISPAIHLGAEKILVIGAGRMNDQRQEVPERPAYPSLAQIGGHALSSIFLDSLAVDVERMQRINDTLSFMSEEQRRLSPLRPIDMLIISPSERLDEMAGRHVQSLPPPIKMLLGAIGGTESGGSALASYLLFESSYTRELLALGRADALARRDDVEAFFSVGGASKTARVPAILAERPS